MPITLSNIWGLFDLPPNEDVKLYKHVDHNSNGYNAVIDDLVDQGHFEAFQSFQSRHVFGDGLVACFKGEAGNSARFLGIWGVVAHGQGNARQRIGGEWPFANHIVDEDHWYHLDRIQGFDPLKNRLVIPWSVGGREHLWHRRGRNTRFDPEIKQLRAIGLARPFPGFDEIIVSHNELVQLHGEGDGGNGWLPALTSTRGVYLIVDEETGDLYVGSATGARGFWGRWAQYAVNVHGGNAELADRVADGRLNPENLRFSVLETLSNLATAADGLVAEVRWKRKLGPRAIALNLN